jgi:hypothetical protein
MPETEWTCQTCGGREPDSVTHCRTCRNPKGSPQVPFVLTVYGGPGHRFYFFPPGMEAMDDVPFLTYTAKMLTDGIADGTLTEGCFNDNRTNSTWGPFVSLWPEEFQFLKTALSEADLGHNEDY